MTADRVRPLHFSFNGRKLAGLEGDTVASALLANGVRTVARSFKYHRPRGVFSAGIEEPNALVRIGIGSQEQMTARAPLVALREGMAVQSQSGWPSVRFDALRIFDFLAPLFAAGFYNKTFMWPSWHLYEPAIRRLAGFGRAALKEDADRYELRNAHCDVLVIGAGVAGLRAALQAASAGRRVILVDGGARAGGQARWDGTFVDGEPASAWIARSADELANRAGVRILANTLAVGCHDHGVVTLVESCDFGASVQERYWMVRTDKIVLATGAIEQPLVFSNNDRPGIMLAGAARRYLACHAIVPGRRIVIATNNDSAYAVACDLHDADATPIAVLDSRTRVSAVHVRRMQEMGVPHFSASMPLNTGGFGALSSVSWVAPAAHGSTTAVRQLACDALLVSGGWNPSLQLFAQAGGRLAYREEERVFAPISLAAGIEIVGGAAGGGGEGAIGPRVNVLGKPGRQWVDLAHDVTVSDLSLAVRENFTCVEHVKRYTTVGMSVDQGKTSTLASLDVLARLRGCGPADLGHTTMRPPLTPVTLGTIAGRSLGERFAPSRVTPLHDWHLTRGAAVEHFGEWRRPAVFLRAGESRDEAVLREGRAVRTGVALFDACPIGKIEIRGPDALEFIDRFYINDLRKLTPGRIRYGLMLRESGVILDDGTVAMLAPNHVMITPTSGRANSVEGWLQEWHQCEWPHMRVTIAQVTDQWGAIVIAGPRAREVLGRLLPSDDLSSARFPHLGLRQTRLIGYPARICRVSFSGEMSFEVHVPREAVPDVWAGLLCEGDAAGIMPYGVDAAMSLRLEKGYLHVGSDTDGTTIPDDVGWGAVARAKQQDFIGKRSLRLPEHCRPDRLQLVGLASQATPLAVGSHLRYRGSREVTDGWITSSGIGPADGKPVSLALLRAGRARLGSEVDVHDMGRVTSTAKVCEPAFYDPAGARLRD